MLFSLCHPNRRCSLLSYCSSDESFLPSSCSTGEISLLLWWSTSVSSLLSCFSTGKSSLSILWWCFPWSNHDGDYMSCLLGCDETNLLDQFLSLLAQELNQIARNMASFGQENKLKNRNRAHRRSWDQQW